LTRVTDSFVFPGVLQQRMEELQKRAIFSFVQHLDQHASDADESLLIASQCLSEHFAMDTSNEEHQALYNSSGKSLLEIFAAGEKALASAATTAPTDASTASVVSTPVAVSTPTEAPEADSSPDEHPIEQTEMFQNFMKIAGPKLFDGLEPGTPEYQRRFTKARDKFMKRYPDQCRKAEEQAAAKAESSAATANAETDAPAAAAEPAFSEASFQKAEAAKASGNTKLRAKDFRGALKYYTDAFTLCPNGPTSHIYLGNRATARILLKDYSGAAADCRHAIRLEPGFAKNYSRLGAACLRLNEIPECLEACKKCLELDPLSSNATKTLQAAQKIQMQNKVTDNAANEPLPSATPPAAATGQMPNFASMLNNPNMASRLQSAMQNPQLMSMAQNMMQNPQMLNSIMSMFGGGGGNGGGGMPDLSALASMMGGAGAGGGAGAAGGAAGGAGGMPDLSAMSSMMSSMMGGGGASGTPNGNVPSSSENASGSDTTSGAGTGTGTGGGPD